MREFLVEYVCDSDAKKVNMMIIQIQASNKVRQLMSLSNMQWVAIAKDPRSEKHGLLLHTLERPIFAFWNAHTFNGSYLCKLFLLAFQFFFNHTVELLFFTLLEDELVKSRGIGNTESVLICDKLGRTSHTVDPKFLARTILQLKVRS